MNSGAILASWDVVLSATASLIVVPLTFITLYLRSMREHQTVKHRELAQRVDRLEASIAHHATVIADVERDFTTKEEWLRETMHARHRIERLMEAMARVEMVVFDAPAPGGWRCRDEDAPGGPGAEPGPRGAGGGGGGGR